MRLNLLLSNNFFVCLKQHMYEMTRVSLSVFFAMKDLPWPLSLKNQRSYRIGGKEQVSLNLEYIN